MATIDFTKQMTSLDGTLLEVVTKMDDNGKPVKEFPKLSWAVQRALQADAKSFEKTLANHQLAKRIVRAKGPVDLTAEQISIIKNQAYEAFKGGEIFGIICDAVDPPKEDTDVKALPAPKE